MQPTSLYLHIPFCLHRCAYCDFNTYAGLDELIPRYVQALCREAQLVAELAPERVKVHTVFFGGGTPSLLPALELDRILSTISTAFDLDEGAEISLEANPGTLSAAYLRDLYRLGVNRLSLGMQSADPEELRLLERQHGYREVAESVAWARQAGFDNLNLDLIFGLPYQTLQDWQRTLDLALLFHPEHFSLYALTLEHGTPMGHWVERGLLSEPDPDVAAEMYEWSSEQLEQSGYRQYEISNWARQTGDHGLRSCRHNLQYWRNQPYLGLGAGAHGYAAGWRTANVLAPKAYITRLLAGQMEKEITGHDFPWSPAISQMNPISREAEMSETMITGLRLTLEGVSNRGFQERFGQGLRDVYGLQLERLERLGLLEWAGEAGDILRLTRNGRLLGNQVFMEFV